MKTLFQYNWMVRDEWYQWCESVNEQELLQPRTGGVGGILKTLFHIADVEWSWMMILQGKPAGLEDFEEFNSLEKIRGLDAKYRQEVEVFVREWEPSFENRLLKLPEPDGTVETHTWGEVMRHIIAHEIHHIGQLSVWSREMGKKPVSASLIGRSLVDKERIPSEQ
ncbi:DinB family protein [Bacillus carboniphilus]|uniref:DinB family protein n=1 Tax=Bacillus carboniphilus TaxID=86663 RepID=A0ABN0WJT0_9BACI